jgi:ribonucleoside-diphosphate reductase alpha chain
MTQSPFETPIAEAIWQSRYRFSRDHQIVDQTPAETWVRVAAALARPESEQARWEAAFVTLMTDLDFLPGGRILAGAGTGRRVTLANCFVMGPLIDDLGSLFDGLKEGALTMQAGGGVGYDFSPLRPAGARAAATANIASGPVSFMHVWDAMCATISATGWRRGAMMATLRCDHPDILAFIGAKADRRTLTHFNCSVQITDALMAAVAADADWPLRFGGRIHRTIAARALWEAIISNAHQGSEPGVLFVDQINRENNLWYRETLTTTNPCGEVPLPPYGACNLGSFNLTRFVREAFTAAARFDLAALAARVPDAVRLLDNAIEVSRYPLAPQRSEARATRRLGLGFMGLGSALIMLGLRYESAAARELAAAIARTIRDAAYEASIELAIERGRFPAFDATRYLESAFARRLPEALRQRIARHGIRNSHLLAIAPTGTISQLANNVSSGIEPVFGRSYRRQLRIGPETRDVAVEDYAWLRWQQRPNTDPQGPAAFVTAADLTPDAHLAMQAAVQPLVDQGISKTINVPADTRFRPLEEIYLQAWRLGLKGVTTFRPHPDRPGILTAPVNRRQAAPGGA